MSNALKIARRLKLPKDLLRKAHRYLKKRKGKSGERVLWLPDNEDRAVLLREHLRAAGVGRAELFADDAGRKNMTFHDLCATGITWAAVCGDDPLRIKQRAGHKAFSTTEIYIREAENLRDGFGSVFPTLPPDLLATRAGGVSALVSALGFVRLTPQPKTRGPEWTNGGSNTKACHLSTHHRQAIAHLAVALPPRRVPMGH